MLHSHYAHSWHAQLDSVYGVIHMHRNQACWFLPTDYYMQTDLCTQIELGRHSYTVLFVHGRHCPWPSIFARAATCMHWWGTWPVMWISALILLIQTLALYKSFTYLLTYLPVPECQCHQCSCAWPTAGQCQDVDQLISQQTNMTDRNASRRR